MVDWYILTLTGDIKINQYYAIQELHRYVLNKSKNIYNNDIISKP